MILNIMILNFRFPHFPKFKFQASRSNSKFKLQTSIFKFHSPPLRLQNSNFKFHIQSSNLNLSNFRFHISNLIFRTSKFKFQSSNFKFQVPSLICAHYKIQVLKLSNSHIVGSPSLKFSQCQIHKWWDTHALIIRDSRIPEITEIKINHELDSNWLKVQKPDLIVF